MSLAFIFGSSSDESCVLLGGSAPLPCPSSLLFHTPNPHIPPPFLLGDKAPSFPPRDLLWTKLNFVLSYSGLRFLKAKFQAVYSHILSAGADTENKLSETSVYCSGRGGVALLGHNVLSSLAIWIVSWQSDRCNELNGLALVVSGHTAHITKPPPKLGPCQMTCSSFSRQDSGPGLLE